MVDCSSAWDHEPFWLHGLSRQRPQFALEEGLLDCLFVSFPVLRNSVDVERGLLLEDGLDAHLSHFLAEHGNLAVCFV